MSADNDNAGHGIVCFSCGGAFSTLRGYYRHRRETGCAGRPDR